MIESATQRALLLSDLKISRMTRIICAVYTIWEALRDGSNPECVGNIESASRGAGTIITVCRTKRGLAIMNFLSLYVILTFRPRSSTSHIGQIAKCTSY